jgi:protease-4
MSQKPLRFLPPSLLLACSAILGACAPESFTITLGAPTDLKETTVFRDEGSPRAKIAMIDVRGLISDVPQPGLIGTSTSLTDEISARLNEAARDRQVEALILRITSPGGTVTGSEIVYREVRRFSEETGKPVVASLGEVAASGGYYTALAADEILVMPTTITGSIGVIIPAINVSQGLSRIGIEARPIMSGPNKNMGDPTSPPDAQHEAILQAMVDEFHAGFEARVHERRPGLEPQYTREATDGRVMSGARALAIGLADREGGVLEAFERAKALAGIESAKLVKYYVGSGEPQTPYSRTVQPQTAEINVIKIEGLASGLSEANAYYLWLPGL